MYRINGCDTFKFDDYQIFDKQIDAVAKVNSLTIVNDGKFNLPSDLQPVFSQLVSQAMFVSTLEQPGPKQRVHLHCSGNNPAGYLIHPRQRNNCQIAQFRPPTKWTKVLYHKSKNSSVILRALGG